MMILKYVGWLQAGRRFKTTKLLKCNDSSREQAHSPFVLLTCASSAQNMKNLRDQQGPVAEKKKKSSCLVNTEQRDERGVCANPRDFLEEVKKNT